MTMQMESFGRPWAYFDARPGRAPGAPPYHSARARWGFGRTLAEAEIGCFESHWQLWRKLAKSPENHAMIILEDDVALDPLFFEQIEKVVQAMVTNGYDFLRLYAIASGPAYPDGLLHGYQVMRYPYAAWGTQAYILTQAGAERLMMCVKRIDRPVDNELDRWWRHGLVSRVVHPFPVRTGGEPSTIEASRADTTPAPRWWRVLLHRRDRALGVFFSICTLADMTRPRLRSG